MILHWDQHIGKYHHRCEECGVTFHGRKNQLYCNVKCKAKRNNGLAADRLSGERALTDAYLRNIQILKKILNGLDNEVVAVPKEHLSMLGFDPEAPNNRIRIDNELWYKMGPYAFRPIQESNEVEIIKPD